MILQLDFGEHRQRQFCDIDLRTVSLDIALRLQLSYVQQTATWREVDHFRTTHLPFGGAADAARRSMRDRGGLFRSVASPGSAGQR